MDKHLLNNNDMTTNYFHFTKAKNLKSISENGLIPKIGFHAQALEVTKKVFFVEGLDNLLILFDCWINVCEKYPHIPGLFNAGSFLMKYKWFPKAFVNFYFKYTEFNKIHKFVAYKYFDMFLKKYVLLNVDIMENIDFSFNDIDQIKTKNYPKEYLIKAGYSPLYSDLESNKMDKWNLHTFSYHGVSAEKLKICYIDNSYHMFDVLMFAIKNTTIDLKNICPVLYNYLVSRNLI